MANCVQRIVRGHASPNLALHIRREYINRSFNAHPVIQLIPRILILMTLTLMKLILMKLILMLSRPGEGAVYESR